MRFQLQVALAWLLSTALLSQGSAAMPVRSATSVALANPPVRVQVPEPPRAKRTVPQAVKTRPNLAPFTRHGPGVHVAGPPMLRPNQIDGVLQAAARRRSIAPAATVPAPSTASARAVRSLPSDATASGTGIHPWWRYQEQSLPGGGRTMVNVGTGNLLVQYDDMTVPHKSIALAFRRTYNSQSLHDVHADDAASFYWKPPGMYGNGWTNTFDAHLARTPDGTLWSVFDIDGTRYDFTSPSGTWIYNPVAGNHTSLAYDGNCGFLWTKKSGTSYYFYRPAGPGGCATLPADGGIAGGFAGRLYQIIGRNRNTTLTFSYAWDNGDASVSGKISTITATTESGQSASLLFSDVNGYRLLQQLTFPDGVTFVHYGYDATGNLVTVSHPANNSAGTQPVQWYGYQVIGTNQVLDYAASPRYWSACSSACGSDGSVVYFGFAGASAPASTVNYIGHYGVVNPSIADASGNSLLQPGYAQTAFVYLEEFYTTGVAAPTYRDTDGHMTNWIADGAGRPTQTQDCTASASQGTQCTGRWLLMNESWDADDNLVAETDPRGNETDYAYDAKANTLAIGGPPTPTNSGTIRPTRLFQYDQYDNVTAFCDENTSSNASANWGSGASPDLVGRCASSSAAWRFQFDNPAYQPYGRLTAITAPDGYRTQIQYDVQKQGAGSIDFGLPTAVGAAPITQFDGSTLTPQQSFWYDSAGYLRCYSKGGGTWVLEYDALGRQTLLSDPDNGATDRTSLCGTTYGGTTGRTKTSYFPGGTIRSIQTPAQVPFGVESPHDYDLDGNETSVTTYHGCVSAPCAGGLTKKYYDGADRLIEVVQPIDAADGDNFPWITRYIYDIGAGQPISFMGTPVVAHGGLFKTQEVYPAPTQPIDMKGQGFDALDRPTNVYTVVPGNSGVQTETTAYDASLTTLGMPTSKTDPLGVVTRFDYDPMGRAANVTFTGDGGVTPDRSFTYDPSGHVVRIDSAMLGTERTEYDLVGRVTKVDEFAGGSTALSSPAQLRYAYYANGFRKSMSVSSAALTADPLMSYAYRNDGARSKLRFSKGGINSDFSWTYSAGGRVQVQTDPFTGGAIPRPAPWPARAPGPVYAGTQYTYGNGLGLATVRLPVNGNFTIGRDAEGDVASYTSDVSSAISSETVSGSLYLTKRGEAIALTIKDVSGGVSTTGTVYSKAPLHGCLVDQAFTTDPMTCDVRTGATTSPGGTGIPTNCAVNYPSSSYSYDKPGRRIAGRSVQVDGESCNDIGWTGTWAYDAENHTTAASGGGGPNFAGCSGAIRWNPHAHPQIVCGTTLHFDGDTLLFGSNAGNALAFLNVAQLGTVLPDNSVLVNDRDYSGQTVMQHGNSKYSAWDATRTVSRYKSAQIIGKIVPGSDGADMGSIDGLAYNYTRPDGFESPFGTVQGTRVSDKDGWTTPDTYAGQVHDPMSQKPFMWNRNNPYAYSDPSGFDPYIIFDPNQAFGNGHVAIAIINPQTGAGTVYTQGPPNGEFGFVRQVATAHPITISDLGKLARGGKIILSEHTTRSQDNAMKARGNVLVGQVKNYNAITCNCDQFVKDILSAGDPTAANVMHLVPRDDVVNLISQGFLSGHPGVGPNGFKNVTDKVNGKGGV